ncbi:MAG: DUF4290 domain-containing protein [Cyclobacteriaceae bacterium]|nr:DUF4290 domain-containing protein [Cyclobacteriaceae bacterium]
MEYNTRRDHLKLREYGRNVQQMTEYLMKIEDREKRNSYASTLVELMKHINPNVGDTLEYDQKVWDDLYIISNFELDVDGPYPKPDPAILQRKPDKVLYHSNEIKYRHYGRSIEILVDQAVALEDPEEKEAAIVTIGKLMKSFYQTWNRESIEDEQVLKTIRSLSKNQLSIDLEKIKEGRLFDMLKRDRDIDPGQAQNQTLTQNRPRSGGGRQFHKGGPRNANNKNRRRRN